jgi:hypothetical protein
MAGQPKKKTSRTKPRSPDKTAAGAKKRAAPAASEPPRDQAQLDGIVNKSFELAQAGVTLGLNLVQKFGSSFQGDLFHKIADAGKGVFSAASGTAGLKPDAPGSPQSAPARTETGAPSPRSGIIENRMPLFPGSQVRVSFSINNDSDAEVMEVTLQAGEFRGELSGAILKADHFTLEPQTTTIQPTDFEKFVLSGFIPINCRHDAYIGGITVGGTESMTIPVCLTVAGRH